MTRNEIKNQINQIDNIIDNNIEYAEHIRDEIEKLERKINEYRQKYDEINHAICIQKQKRNRMQLQIEND